MRREPSKIELLLSAIALVVMVYPDVVQPRVWWYATMHAARHGARRCGQLALLAEHRYRQEVG